MRAVRVLVLSSLLISIACMRANADPIQAASEAPAASAAPSGSPSPGAAQNEPAKLPPVVVTATRIQQPLSEIGTTVTVVDQQQIQSQRIQSMTEDRKS